MVTASLLEPIGTACKRYGPGRLPYAARRDVGAGYAGASAAVLAVLAFVPAVLVADALGAFPGGQGSVFAALGLYAGPFVVPAAFVSAFALARILPAGVPYYGVVAGLLGTFATYVVATVGFAAVFTAIAIVDASGAAPTEALVFSGVVGVAAFAYSCWVTIPLGCVGGFVYARVGAAA